jgi:hexosaminidase
MKNPTVVASEATDLLLRNYRLLAWRLGMTMCVALAACSRKPATPPVPDPLRIAVVPAPMSLTRGSGVFALDSLSVILTDANADSAKLVANALATQLRPATGFRLLVLDVVTDTVTRGAIRLRLDESRVQDGDEGYRLVVTSDSVSLVARRPAGLFRGFQTIRQLLPFGIESHNSVIKMGDWRIPVVTIEDRPRFAWRGAMLDVARHFFTVDEVKQYIDMLALYKINVLHLHLSDDQGWRIEIKSRPQLTAQASATEVGGGAGGFYTQDDYREIVRYAAERFITVVPEIDMPGHTNAMLIPFPHLSCGRQAPAPYFSIRVGFSAICPESAETWTLLDDVVREISALTPGPYFHVGGDEVEELKGGRYERFMERVQDLVIRYGKRPVGWEEMAKGQLRPGAIAQQWRSDSNAAKNAVAQGGKVLMSPAKRIYIDMKYAPTTELGLRWAGIVTLRTTYDWDPATFFSGVAESSILGVEAPLWAESIRNISAAFYLALPRIPSVAEVGWTPQASRDFGSFTERIAAHAPRWRLLGMNYHRSQEVRWY